MKYLNLCLIFLFVLTSLIAQGPADHQQVQQNAQGVDSTVSFGTMHSTWYRIINKGLVVVENAVVDFDKVYSKLKECMVIWIDADKLNSTALKNEVLLKIDIEKAYKKTKDSAMEISKKMDNESERIVKVVDLLVWSLNDCYEHLNFVRQIEVRIRLNKIIARMERIKYGTPKGTDTLIKKIL